MGDAYEKEMTFWDHLDELRKVFFRIVLAVVLLACVAFLFKDLFPRKREDAVLFY